MNKIAPSLFAADLSDLGETIRTFERVKVDMIHFDVMDNHFVPNISFGPKLVADVKRRTKIPADVHLMIDLDSPGRYRPFLELPVEHITIHMEAGKHELFGIIDAIRAAKKTVGLSLKPATPVIDIQPYLDRIDLVLLMSVEPGFSGQKFLPESLGRIRELKQLVGHRKIDIQVDGGIDRDNYRHVLDCGANVLVMGSGFYGDKNIEELVLKVKG
jgi:ribulose-phosphate 3-epimerase